MRIEVERAKKLRHRASRILLKYDRKAAPSPMNHEGSMIQTAPDRVQTDSPVPSPCVRGLTYSYIRFRNLARKFNNYRRRFYPAGRLGLSGEGALSLNLLYLRKLT